MCVTNKDPNVTPGKMQYHRGNPHPQHDLIVDFAQLANALENTPFSWMLEADGRQQT